MVLICTVQHEDGSCEEVVWDGRVTNDPTPGPAPAPGAGACDMVSRGLVEAELGDGTSQLLHFAWNTAIADVDAYGKEQRQMTVQDIMEGKRKLDGVGIDDMELTGCKTVGQVYNCIYDRLLYVS